MRAARSRGLGARVLPYVLTGVALTVLFTVLGLLARLYLADPVPTHPFPSWVMLLDRLVAPAGAIGVALLVLAWLERHVALLVLAWLERHVALLVFTLGYLAVWAGLGFDGPMQSVPPVAGIDRPFMLMTAEFTRATEPSIEQFWSNLSGWRLNVQADGAAHSSYCDNQWLIPQLARLIGMSDEDLAGWIGTLDPARAVRIQQAYPLAFFNLHLRHQRQRLLEGPNPAFPKCSTSSDTRTALTAPDAAPPRPAYRQSYGRAA
ncbi:hypothetical protein QQG74_20910 [Micromonospora sp. FIMYZ51]|uniref:hypothetical protein n=1 Tax=Micromonospora sp. FIMYZ51 TaxID=3051832 RepID=UPI00311DBCA8